VLVIDILHMKENAYDPSGVGVWAVHALGACEPGGLLRGERRAPAVLLHHKMLWDWHLPLLCFLIGLLYGFYACRIWKMCYTGDVDLALIRFGLSVSTVRTQFVGG